MKWQLITPWTASNILPHYSIHSVFSQRIWVKSTWKVGVQHLWIYRLSHYSYKIYLCLSHESPFLVLTHDLSHKLPVSKQKERIRESMQIQVLCRRRKTIAERTVVPTLAWWRSTPYIESFLAFSRKCISASAGVIPLRKSNQFYHQCYRSRVWNKIQQLENIFSLSELNCPP